MPSLLEFGRIQLKMRTLIIVSTARQDGAEVVQMAERGVEGEQGAKIRRCTFSNVR